MNNWNEWKRMQINIDKALCNDDVAELLNKHYPYLHSRLVRFTSDEDIFNDTFLKLTYNYNPDKDFIDLFCYYFNLLKGAYLRDSKVTKWLETYIEDNPLELPDYTEPETLEVVDKTDFLNKLKEGINANIKESTKSKELNL